MDLVIGLGYLVQLLVNQTGWFELDIMNKMILQQSTFCKTSDLGLRLEVDFVFSLSQEEQEQEPSPKFLQTRRY